MTSVGYWQQELLAAWDARDDNHKFELVCIPHHQGGTELGGWHDDITPWARRNAIRIIPIAEQCVSTFNYTHFTSHYITPEVWQTPFGKSSRIAPEALILKCTRQAMDLSQSMFMYQFWIFLDYPINLGDAYYLMLSSKAALLRIVELILISSKT